MKKEIFIVLISLLLSLNIVYADYSIDISGLKQSYSVGEQINYNVLLLENNKPVDKNVEVVFTDKFGKNEIRKTVISNAQNTLLISENFPSMGWYVKASYEGKEVTRSFLISENSKVEFVIEGDRLIIRNKGNVIYSKDVKVKIGEEESVYTQNIPIEGEKVWILVAPEGTYNIEVSDGVTSITKSNVKLNSVATGNAIGVMSEEFHGTGFSTSPIDPKNMDKSFISTDKLPVVLVFIGCVGVLLLLLFIERRFRNKN